MIHCQMTYSDNKFYRSSGEGRIVLGGGGQDYEDGKELGLEQGKWLHLRWSRQRRRHFGNLARGIGKSICWCKWRVSQTFFLERLLETVRKKEEYSVSSWRS